MIYLDNNALTFIAPEVRQEIETVLSCALGNPSSSHRFGQLSRALLVTALQKIAGFLGIRPEELFFTSGATEALNMVIEGFSPKGHVISSYLEHHAVLHSLQRLEKKGMPVTYLKGEQGFVDVEQIREVLRPETRLIVLMAVNNETGIKTDIAKIAAFAEARGIAFIVDGVSLLGREAFTIPRGVSAMCFSSHKIHGPSGVGLVFIRKGVKVDALIVGGPQQRGRRAGTENLPGIMGLAKAFELINLSPDAAVRMKRLRDRLEEGILAQIPDVIIHGKEQERICNVSNMAFLGIDGEMLLMRLDMKGVAVSLGAACATGGIEPSHVLLNMGVPLDIATSSLRFSLSRYTTEEEIEETIKIVCEEVSSLSTRGNPTIQYENSLKGILRH